MDVETLTSLLQELQSRLEHPLDAMKPHFIELNNPKPSGRTDTHGIWTTTLNAITDPEGHKLFVEIIPHGCVIKGIFWIEEMPALSEEKPKGRQKKAKEPKPGRDDYGKFWQWFTTSGLLANEEACEALGIESYDLWDEYLKIKYEVSSRRELDPQRIIDDLRLAGCNRAADRCENAWNERKDSDL